MIGYADPELLLLNWLRAEFQGKLKFWADPELPDNWPFTAPIVHLQRGASGATQLTLDDVVLDVDVYSKVSDHARKVASDVWAALTLPNRLPSTVLPGGIFVKRVDTEMAPRWAPDPGVKRRSASYRIILHGLVT